MIITRKTELFAFQAVGLVVTLLVLALAIWLAFRIEKRISRYYRLPSALKYVFCVLTGIGLYLSFISVITRLVY